MADMSEAPEVKAALIAHLSREIEMSMNALIAQRSRNHLVIALGPFIILGVIVANGSALSRLQDLTTAQLLAITVTSIFGYAVLGYLSAMIEAKFWLKANAWRREIAKLTGCSDETLQVETKGLYLTYMGIYVTLAIVFAALVWILTTGS